MDSKAFNKHLKASRNYLKLFRKQLSHISSMLDTIESRKFHVSLREVGGLEGFNESETENILGLLGWSYNPETNEWSILKLQEDPSLRIVSTRKVKKEEN
ncbi:MAG: hypothetical protein RLY98_1474 [Bacteroidota bacterium]|jgi:hypothetical protein